MAHQKNFFNQLSITLWKRFSIFFHLIILLNPDCNCSKSLLRSSVDKVANGQYNVVSVIWNVVFAGSSTPYTTTSFSQFASPVDLLVNTQFSDHVKTRLTSQLLRN